MKLFCRLVPPLRSLLIRHTNLVTTLVVTQCDTFPHPPQPFEKSPFFSSYSVPPFLPFGLAYDSPPLIFDF